MNIAEFKLTAKAENFILFPSVNTGKERLLKDFVLYKEATNDLKIRLATIILCRNFPPTMYIPWVEDVYWFIDSFLEELDSDLHKPWISGAVKESFYLIRSADMFIKYPIGTTFMFGVVESFAKWLLGYRHLFYASKEEKDKFSKIGIGKAIQLLKKGNNNLSRELSYIDNYNKLFFRIKRLQVEPNMKRTIAERLTYARNLMVHGENYSHATKGEYLILLYSLFYLIHSTNSERLNKAN